MTDYKQPADDFCKAHDITVEFKPCGLRAWPNDSSIVTDYYTVVFSRPGKTFTTDFYDSQDNTAKHHAVYDPDKPCMDHHRRALTFHEFRKWKNTYTPPRPYDIISIMEKSDPGMFLDWASDRGENTDSIKALNTYNLCCQEWIKIRKFFTAEEIAELQEIN